MNIKHNNIEEEGGKPNKGHKFGFALPLDSYYFADAIRVNDEGQIEFFCVHPTHCRYGKMIGKGLVIDYSPTMTIDQFKQLSGQL